MISLIEKNKISKRLTKSYITRNKNINILTEKKRLKKQMIPELETLYKDGTITENQYNNFKHCSNIVYITQNTHRAMISYKCHNSLCPICLKEKEQQDLKHIEKIDKKLKEEGYKTIFLTLTIKNLLINEELNIKPEKQLDIFRMYAKNAIYYFNNDRQIKKSFTGGKVIKTEYTIPKYNDIHLHFHMLIYVEKDYFTSDKYISQEKISKIWSRCLNNAKNMTKKEIKTKLINDNIKNYNEKLINNYENEVINLIDSFNNIDINNICWIEKTKEEERNKELKEIVKYISKTTDIINLENKQQRVNTMKLLLLGLKSVKTITFTGLCRSIKKDITEEEKENKDNRYITEDGEYIIYKGKMEKLIKLIWSNRLNKYCIDEKTSNKGGFD